MARSKTGLVRRKQRKNWPMALLEFVTWRVEASLMPLVSIYQWHQTRKNPIADIGRTIFRTLLEISWIPPLFCCIRNIQSWCFVLARRCIHLSICLLFLHFCELNVFINRISKIHSILCCRFILAVLDLSILCLDFCGIYNVIACVAYVGLLA